MEQLQLNLFEDKPNKNKPEIQMLINKAVNFGFKTFVNNNNELIIIPEINSYFRLDDVETELDFKCKILHWLSYDCASNHWDKRWSPKMINFINYMLDVDWNQDVLQAIYCRFGNGLNHDLCIKFIQSNYDLTLIQKDECKNCRGDCFNERTN